MSAAEPETAGDGRSESAQWPWMKFPEPAVGARSPGFGALIRQSALDLIEVHGSINVHEEVCGVLVGNVYQDEAGPWLYVLAAIRGDSAPGTVSQVTFTSETWTHIHQEFDRHFVDQRIVGWYHTHPGHGIFLSGMDLFIHENFFNLPWQVALVFDPQRREHGIFVWKDQHAVRDDFLIEPAEVGNESVAAEIDDRVMRQWLRFPAALAAKLSKLRRPAKPVPPRDVP